MGRLKRALVIGNGDIPRKDILLPLARSSDYIVCADGGARHARRLGIRPDVILGDLDSLSPSSRGFFSGTTGNRRRRGVPVVEIADQESTDIEKALLHLLRKGAREVVLTGATGSRIDHSCLALGCFKKFGRRISMQIVDRAGTVTALNKKTRLTMEPGEHFSLIPLGRCSGVTLENARYRLKGSLLEQGVRDGVSNEALGTRVSVRYRTGILLLYRFHTKPKRPARRGRDRSR